MSEKKHDERVIVSARVSSKAAAGWRTFCHQNGVSLSALIEVAGLHLSEESFPPRIEARQRMVDDARKVDIKRRARKRD